MSDEWWTEEFCEKGLEIAIQQAEKSFKEGGIPIGASILSHDSVLLSSGHNQRVQKNSWIHHGETNCIENLPKEAFKELKQAAIFTTLSPCSMCTGSILLYKIPVVVIGENSTFMGEEELLRSRGVKVIVMNSEKCKKLMTEFIEKNPTLWNFDIGIIEEKAS